MAFMVDDRSVAASVGGTRRWPPGTVLDALDDTDRAALVGLGTERTFPPGEALIIEGSQDDTTFVLLDGIGKVLANTVDGRQVLLSIRIGGDLVGEFAALDGKPRSASVVAATVVTARSVDRRTFLRYLDEHPRGSAAIRGAIVAELRRATMHRASVNGAPTVVRVALVLSQMMAAYGRPGRDGVHIEIPLSQPELASLINVSEPSLHRALSGLRARDVIRTGYRRLVVRDPAALRDIIG